MKVKIFDFDIDTSINDLDLNAKGLLVNTINPHSYCVSKSDPVFKVALQKSDILLPDGIGIVLAAKILQNKSIQRIAGSDLHMHLLGLANQSGKKVFYLGSSLNTLQLIKRRLKTEFPNVIFDSYSPPFKPEFSKEDNQAMIEVINAFKPHVLFVGMTAPKQEKWAYHHKNVLDVNVIASIGAVFDFYAGTVKRAPKWLQKIGLEWLHRGLSNPKRLGKRIMLSNPEFILDIIKLKLRFSK